MFVAVLKKDLSLLRNYWRSAAVATIVCYAIAAVFVVWLTEYQDESMQQIGARSFLVLGVGSRIGMVVTVIFTVALAGSVFTLERSDRSAEFLACLPPTRLMNLSSKMGIVFGAALLMTGVHWLAILMELMLVPYVPATNIFGTAGESGIRGLVGMLALNLNMTGAALAVSAWMQSNGVPILAGLLAPVMTRSLIQLASYALDIPMDGNAFAIISALLGLLLTFCAGIWYTQRIEP